MSGNDEAFEESIVMGLANFVDISPTLDIGFFGGVNRAEPVRWRTGRDLMKRGQIYQQMDNIMSFLLNSENSPMPMPAPVASNVESILGQLADIMDEISERAHTYFAPCAQVRWIVARDPESFNEVTVSVFVPVDYDVEESISRMDKFEEEWWFDWCTRLDFNVVVHAEHRV